jgi:2',3'-cyclic-nucleotide 2'-phosphodiesterase / 3'-nucleotidase / 5'-nucleotidase
MHLLLALTLAVQQPQHSAAPDTAHLVLVATTDVHGRLLGWDYVRDREAPGGLSRAASILASLRGQYPGQVIVVDAGDLLEGNLFADYFGRVERRHPDPLVDAVGSLQYDVATPGNHDFDFGADVLFSAASDASYRYVSANIVTGPRDSLVFPQTLVVQRGGVRVGVTGFTTPGVMVWDRRQLGGRLRVRRIADAAPGALAALDRAGVDVKVVLIHSGLGTRSSYDTTGIGPENDAAALAALPSKPDLVVVGHTHREIRDTVLGGVHFVQPKNWALSLAVVHLSLVRDSSARRWRLTDVRGDLIPLANVPQQPSFVQRFADAQQRVRAWGDAALGTAGPGYDARYGRVQSTPLIDFLNDVQRRHASAQLSATPDFDVSAGLPDGAVRRRDVAGIYPYTNTLVAVRISGAQLKDFLEHASAYYRTIPTAGSIIDPAVPGYNFDAVRGATYRIDLARPVGSRIIELAVGGRAVTPGDSFTLATNSYRAAGGGGYDMLRGARVVYDRGENMADLIAADIQAAGTVQGIALAPTWSIVPPGDSLARAAFAPPPPPLPQTDSTLLRVLAITDFHGALQSHVWPWSAGRPVGGAAALKPWLDSLARECGCATVRLDGGDEMQGTPLSSFAFGKPVIAAFNALSLDAAAIGNHEFDWTVDTLRAREHEARYPFVSANVTDSVGRFPDFVQPWVSVSRAGARVAIIGLTTQTTPQTTRPQNVTGLAFGDLAAAVRRFLPAARAAADFVIVLAHAGEACDSAGCMGEIFALASALDSGAVDLIVAGHTHQRVDTVIHGIPIVEAASSGRAVAVVDFIRRAGTAGRTVRARLETPWADSVRPDPELAAAIAHQQLALDSITGREVTTLRAPLRRLGHEYPLGRLVADAYRNIGKADVGLINDGGIRADLAAGPTSYGALFEVLPFQNRLVRLTLPAATLRAALEHALADGTPQVHVSGLEVWYDATRPVGRRITRIRLANGRGLDGHRLYTIAVPDFVADGGDGFTMLRPLQRVDAGMVDLDALIAYLRVIPQPVAPPAEDRFHTGSR